MTNRDGLYRISLHRGVVGLGVSGGLVIRAAPLAGWTRGKTIDWVIEQFAQQNATIMRLEGDTWMRLEGETWKPV